MQLMFLRITELRFSVAILVDGYAYLLRGWDEYEIYMHGIDRLIS